MGGLVLIIILVLVIALIQQNRYYKDKKRCRESEQYASELRELPYMGYATPRAPTETTSLWNEARELPGMMVFQFYQIIILYFLIRGFLQVIPIERLMLRLLPIEKSSPKKMRLMATKLVCIVRHLKCGIRSKGNQIF